MSQKLRSEMHDSSKAQILNPPKMSELYLLLSLALIINIYKNNIPFNYLFQFYYYYDYFCPLGSVLFFFLNKVGYILSQKRKDKKLEIERGNKIHFQTIYWEVKPT